jgi:hypothetical protein
VKRKEEGDRNEIYIGRDVQGSESSRGRVHYSFETFTLGLKLQPFFIW